MDNLVSFWVQVVDRLANKRRSAAWLAGKLNVPAQTLSSWKKRGQFRVDCLGGLREHLDWTELDSSLALEHGVDLIRSEGSSSVEREHPTEKVMRIVHQDYRVTEKSFRRYAKNSIKVINSLGANTLFAFSSCTSSPFEFEENEQGEVLVRAIAGAIYRGALCLYVRPTDKVIAKYKEMWSYGHLVYFLDSVKEIELFRTRVRNLLVAGDAASKRDPMEPGQAEQIVYERLDQCYVNSSPMWMPGIGLSMIGWHHEREFKTRIAISLPGARFGGVLVYPHYALLEDRFVRFIGKVVSDAGREIKAITEGRKGGVLKLILPDDSKYVQWSGTFYMRYSHLLRSVYSPDPTDDSLSNSSPLDFGSL